MNLNNEKINKLIGAAKCVSAKQSALNWKVVNKNRQLNIDATSDDGQYDFVIYIRQNALRKHDFSCGIRLVVDGKNDITLARYNGSSHVHVNKIDNKRFDFQCHIHVAKEESLKHGSKIEDYAEPTDRYTTLALAIQCLFTDYNIIGINPDQLLEQGGLFDEY